MILNNNIDLNELIGHSTLLYGETNTKKTYYTAKFIKYLLDSKKIPQNEISILDFAPPQINIKNMNIGGKIKDFYEKSLTCRNIPFRGEITPPRLNANNRKEVYENACKNYKKTSKILKIYNGSPTSILFINDISIYLHIGNIKLLLESIKKSSTFFGNSYYGSSISSSFTKLFSLREKRLVQYLIKKVEYSYYTE